MFFQTYWNRTKQRDKKKCIYNVIYIVFINVEIVDKLGIRLTNAAEVCINHLDTSASFSTLPSCLICIQCHDRRMFVPLRNFGVTSSRWRWFASFDRYFDNQPHKECYQYRFEFEKIHFRKHTKNTHWYKYLCNLT